jgi:CRISPR-associated protein Cmr4
MYQQKKLLYLYCETPLHAGSGSELGIVDLPIQRERTTGYPKIEASSLKGALREHFCRSGEGEKDAKVNRFFGPAPDSDEQNMKAGTIALTDARLLCLPVRSAAGVFAWVTCPGVLQRWCRDAGISFSPLNIPTGHAMALSNSNVIVKNAETIVLEEFAFTVQTVPQPLQLADQLAETLFPEKDGWYEKLMCDLVVLHDEDFAYFAENATEVITRVRISQQTGTVEPGALWTEEYLPAESILYSLVLTGSEFVTKDDERDGVDAEHVMAYVSETLAAAPRFQLGGNATLGKGNLLTKFVATE